jgi:hypothetical protein
MPDAEPGGEDLMWRKRPGMRTNGCVTAAFGLIFSDVDRSADNMFVPMRISELRYSKLSESKKTPPKGGNQTELMADAIG